MMYLRNHNAMSYSLHAANIFLQSRTGKTYSKAMPPGGRFEPTNGNFSSILNLISVTLTRNVYCMFVNDLAEFQRDPSVRTRDIGDFDATVGFQ